MTTSINILTILYHMHISLLINLFNFQSQTQISKELHNYQYYSISIISLEFTNYIIKEQNNQNIVN